MAAPDATAWSSKSAHGADAAAHFNEEAFDDVGGAQTFPMELWTIKEGQQVFEIPFQAGHSLGGLPLPALSEENSNGHRTVQRVTETA